MGRYEKIFLCLCWLVWFSSCLFGGSSTEEDAQTFEDKENPCDRWAWASSPAHQTFPKFLLSFSFRKRVFINSNRWIFLYFFSNPLHLQQHDAAWRKRRHARYKGDQSSICFFGQCSLSHWPKGSNWKNSKLWSISSLAIWRLTHGCFVFAFFWTCGWMRHRF